MKRSEFIKGIIITISSLSTFPKSGFTYSNIPKIGSKAPDFKLYGTDGIESEVKEWGLNLLNNKWILLYFYPKDFSSGCTLEARGFVKYSNEFKKNKCQIIGISSDSSEDHESFCLSEKIGYPLLSDKEGIVSQLYGSWQRPYSQRNSFLINSEGIIQYRWIGVKPSRHASEVLSKLNQLNL